MRRNNLYTLQSGFHYKIDEMSAASCYCDYEQWVLWYPRRRCCPRKLVLLVMTNCPLNLWPKFEPSLAIQLLLQPPRALLTFHRPHRHRNHVKVHGMRDEQRRATGATKSMVDHGPPESVRASSNVRRRSWPRVTLSWSLAYLLFATKGEPQALRQLSQWHRMLAKGAPLSSYWMLRQRQEPLIDVASFAMPGSGNFIHLSTGVVFRLYDFVLL